MPMTTSSVSHAQKLLEHFAGGRGGNKAHVFKNIAEIEIQIVGQRRGRAHAYNINTPRTQNRADRTDHLRAVQRLRCHADGVGVALQNAGHDVLIAELVAGDLDALDAGELVPDKLLQRLLHLRIARVAQLHGEAHNSRLRNLDGLAETAGRHKRRLVIVGQDIGRDLFLAFGKGVNFVLNTGQNICRHKKSPPPHALSANISQFSYLFILPASAAFCKRKSGKWEYFIRIARTGSSQRRKQCRKLQQVRHSIVAQRRDRLRPPIEAGRDPGIAAALHIA